MISLHDIKKSYGNRLVLDIPKLDFEARGRYAVIGSNGSGKTTLLRTIAGTLLPDTGTVEIPQALQKNRGYMPQQPYIFGFSVLKNVIMALENKDEAQNQALSALKTVGMEPFTRARGKSLSGGEAQRVAIARMIAEPRKLLILDEPTSSTDIAGNDLIEAAILHYLEITGCTLIFATHSPAQAKRLSQNLILLDEGRIIENGLTETVLSCPESTQCHEFLQHWKM